ncbi:unnamed protein product [Discosporangium mesarthrocarpum]
MAKKALLTYEAGCGSLGVGDSRIRGPQPGRLRLVVESLANAGWSALLLCIAAPGTAVLLPLFALGCTLIMGWPGSGPEPWCMAVPLQCRRSTVALCVGLSDKGQTRIAAGKIKELETFLHKVCSRFLFPTSHKSQCSMQLRHGYSTATAQIQTAQETMESCFWCVGFFVFFPFQGEK